jgi:hypothetical protein
MEKLEPTPFPNSDILAIGTHVSETEMAMPFRMNKEELTAEGALKQEYAGLTKFYTDSVCLLRGSQPQISRATFDGYTDNVCDYLGFVRKHCGYTDDLTLWLATRGDLLEKYVNFKHARGNDATYECKSYAHLTQTLKYLCATTTNEGGKHVMHKLIADMQTVTAQIKRAAPAKQRADVCELEADGKWVAWPLLISATLAYAQAALTTCEASREAILLNNATAEVIDLSILLTDALLALLMVVLPPNRQRAWRSLVLLNKPGATDPAHKCSICDDTPTCKGNTLRRVGGGAYELLLTHHKNARRQGNKPIGPLALSEEDYTTPLLLHILDEVFTWAHTTRVDAFPKPDDATASWKYMAFHDRNGGAFQDDKVGTSKMTDRCKVVFQRVLANQDVHLTPTQLRHIFVTGVRDSADASHLHLTHDNERALSRAMGNSPKTWNTVYDNNNASRAHRNAMHALQTHIDPSSKEIARCVTTGEAHGMNGPELRELHHKLFPHVSPTTSRNLKHLRKAVTGTLPRGLQNNPRKRLKTDDINMPQPTPVLSNPPHVPLDPTRNETCKWKCIIA